MLTIAAILASLVFFGWLFYRAIKQKPVRAHTVTRVIAYVTCIYTFTFFLTMDIPQLIKILASIILGAVLIVIAAYIQRRRQMTKS
ncbi:MAG: hypothetical protein PHQ86_00940 [Dehalococcoidales bacterium]|nr:hypothetical protein [Dehalococcoidales bacterium]